MFGLVVCGVLGVLLFVLMRRSSSYPVRGRHVLITGGSSGIGLAMAMEARRQGANVTIVARNAGRLKEAEEKLLATASKSGESGWVHALSLDVTADWSKVKAELDALVELRGVVHVLVNCAGFAEAFYFDDGSQEKFERLMQLNYFGSVAVTHALLPSMREFAKTEEGAGGCICFISSMAGQIGVFGYTAYSGSKFALRGLAEALHWELLTDGISVTMGFPPDTDTRGYELEQVGKPVETVAISEAAGLLQPDAVAKKIFQDVLHRRFLSGMGFDGFLLSTLSAGMAPADSLHHVVLRACICGPLHLIAAGYRFWMRCVIRAVASKKAAAAAEKKDD